MSGKSKVRDKKVGIHTCTQQSVLLAKMYETFEHAVNAQSEDKKHKPQTVYSWAVVIITVISMPQTTYHGLRETIAYIYNFTLKVHPIYVTVLHMDSGFIIEKF